MTNNLSRQYLKAMGIDSWRHRDAKVTTEFSHNEPAQVGAASLQTALAPNPESATGRQPETGLNHQVSRWSVSSVDESLRDSKVVISNLSEDGQILLVLERELTSPAEDLLAAMLKAIKIDRLSQSTVNFSQSGQGESLVDVCGRVKPAIVLVMAMLTDSSSIAELDTHRSELHRFSWVSVPVAITLHPQVLLKNPDGKRPAWEDLKRVKAFLDG